MIKWNKIEEFDYGVGDILLLMKADPKKKVWRREQGFQPEGKYFKVRDDVVTKCSYTEEELKQCYLNGNKVWEEGHFDPAVHGLTPGRKEGDTFCIYNMSRTAWDNVVAWMWKKDLIDEYIKNSD